MSLEKKISGMFSLSGDSWEKHANPWSVWSRFVTLPFIVLAIWSHVWIGWFCLLPIVLLIVWIFVNPTFFDKPKSYDSWESQAVLGEKFYAERKDTPIAHHHKTPVLILTLIQTIGGVVLIIGLINTHIYLTILGVVIIYLSKMWFLDRMVWICKEMKK